MIYNNNNNDPLPLTYRVNINDLDSINIEEESFYLGTSGPSNLITQDFQPVQCRSTWLQMDYKFLQAPTTYEKYIITRYLRNLPDLIKSIIILSLNPKFCTENKQVPAALYTGATLSIKNQSTMSIMFTMSTQSTLSSMNMCVRNILCVGGQTKRDSPAQPLTD